MPGTYVIGCVKNYDWGKLAPESAAALSLPKDLVKEDSRVAEVWYGTHKSSPSFASSSLTSVLRGKLLLESSDKEFKQDHLLSSKLLEIGCPPKLPYLVKILSVARPLSLQVHPNSFFAKELYGDYSDIFPDSKSKPECVYSLTDFYSLTGWKTNDQMMKMLGLDDQLTNIFVKHLGKRFIDVIQREYPAELDAMFNDNSEDEEEKATDGEKHEESREEEDSSEKHTESLSFMFPEPSSLSFSKVMNDVSFELASLLLPLDDDEIQPLMSDIIDYCAKINLIPEELVKESLISKSSLASLFSAGGRFVPFPPTSPMTSVTCLLSLFVTLFSLHPNDPACLSPFFLQYRHLPPFTPLFLAPLTPHLHVYGDVCECMKTSDNVVRGGCTKKWVDMQLFLEMCETTIRRGEKEEEEEDIDEEGGRMMVETKNGWTTNAIYFEGSDMMCYFIKKSKPLSSEKIASIGEIICDLPSPCDLQGPIMVLSPHAHKICGISGCSCQEMGECIVCRDFDDVKDMNCEEEDVFMVVALLT
ncbi:putative multi-domain containing protein [Aduncisulcus paluster]|uniref:Multi-domain containing protein n=1 Tax=Aduncisulcus paluster TaxID=2918883 RepID=A0ABQ5JWS9_9EUKA|nr:putative multi-domain containing protein [Aduncisulcus paluster]